MPGKWTLRWSLRQLCRKFYLNAGNQIRGRSIVAYQRRLVHRGVIEIPSDAKHQVVRGARPARGAGAKAAGQVQRAVPGNFGRNTASRPIAGRNAQT